MSKNNYNWKNGIPSTCIYVNENCFRDINKIISLLPSSSFRIQCAFYPQSTFQLRGAELQVLDGHGWSVATVLDTHDLFLFQFTSSGQG